VLHAIVKRAVVVAFVAVVVAIVTVVTVVTVVAVVVVITVVMVVAIVTVVMVVGLVVVAAVAAGHVVGVPKVDPRGLDLGTVAMERCLILVVTPHEGPSRVGGVSAVMALEGLLGDLGLGPVIRCVVAASKEPD